MDIEELAGDRIKALCTAHGGKFHGPNVESLSMPEYLLPALFKAVAEIALEHLTTANQSLMAEVFTLKNERAQRRAEVTGDVARRLNQYVFDILVQHGAECIAPVLEDAVYVLSRHAEEVQTLKDENEVLRGQVPTSLDCYDAGYLNDRGGGDVNWWQDYMRAELGRAHDFYESQLPPALHAEEVKQA